jgi:heat shock protein HslJ
LRTRLLSLAALIALFQLGACGSSDDAVPRSSPVGAADLEGSNWIITGFLLPAGGTAEAVAGATATLTFGAGGALKGSTGCNSFSGTYDVSGTSLTIQLGPSTLKACLDAAATAQERAVVSSLADVRRYAVEGEEGEELRLQDAAEATLLTYRAGATSLEGTSWAVRGVNNGSGAVVTSAPTEKLTASFGTDGSFSGFGGCNTLAGPYGTSGRDGVTIGPLSSTEKSCGEEADRLEAQYAAALAATTRFELEGDQLTLRDGNGAAQVTASAATSPAG